MENVGTPKTHRKILSRAIFFPSFMVHVGLPNFATNFKLKNESIISEFGVTYNELLALQSILLPRWDPTMKDLKVYESAKKYISILARDIKTKICMPQFRPRKGYYYYYYY